MAYQGGKFAGVGDKMRALADRAVFSGMRQAYLDALKHMMSRLQKDPLEWGDPLYRTKHQEDSFVMQALGRSWCATLFTKPKRPC